MLHPARRNTVAYRSLGAQSAAAAGALAALVRSMTPFALGNAHTGGGSITGQATPVPAAAISLADADMLARMAARGWRPRVRLVMGAEDRPAVMSRNVVAEIRGSTFPDEARAVESLLSIRVLPAAAVLCP